MPMRRKAKDVDALVAQMETMGIEDADATTANVERVENTEPFRFFDLPSELRWRVYELCLVFPRTIDLDPTNSRTVAPRLGLFRVSRRMHDEGSRVFYGQNTFRIFPIHGRYINKKHPLLAWLPRRHRALITRLELRLGPGFTRPPKSWVVDKRLGLAAATKVFRLKVFVEIDPASNEVFEGFRLSNDFYTQYCVGLLRALFAHVPSILEVEFDAYPSVSKSSPLLKGLVSETTLNQKRITWGPERGWDKIVEVDLANVLQNMALGSL